MGADRQECRVEPAGLHRFKKFVDLGIELELDAEIEDPLYFRIEHVARQPVLGNAEAHHPAGRRPGIVDRDGVAHAAQMIGRGQGRTVLRRPPARACRFRLAAAVKRQLSLIASSPRKRSTELIPTASSTCARLQALSQG